MLQQLASQALNGFTVKDLPFFFLQLSVSSILAWIIRRYWKSHDLSHEESKFVDFLIPVQIILTCVAIFSIRSPWMIVLYGFLALIPLIGVQSLSMRSRAFYLACIFIAFGTGAANLVVTVLVTLLGVMPFMHFYRHHKKQ